MEIGIPKGIRTLRIETSEAGVMVCFVSKMNDSRTFPCKETDHEEEIPTIGDFSVFWNDRFPDAAMIGNLIGISAGRFLANSGIAYEHAIKFRDYKQYLEVRKINEDLDY